LSAPFVRDPERCSLAYTPDSIWRNRSSFIRGRAEIVSFLEDKWSRELDYRLRKELFAFADNKIAVQFWYEYRDAEMARQGKTVWRRAYGLEDWTFDGLGKMEKRMMSCNEVEIDDAQRWFRDGVDVDEVEISGEHW